MYHDKHYINESVSHQNFLTFHEFLTFQTYHSTANVSLIDSKRKRSLHTGGSDQNARDVLMVVLHCTFLRPHCIAVKSLVKYLASAHFTVKVKKPWQQGSEREEKRIGIFFRYVIDTGINTDMSCNGGEKKEEELR